MCMLWIKYFLCSDKNVYWLIKQSPTPIRQYGPISHAFFFFPNSW
jgi:hypothetical protein